MHAPRTTLWLVVIPALCLVGALVSTGLASDVTIPNQFVNGTVADADEMNQNFVAVRDAVNDNDARLDAMETAAAETQHLHVYGASFAYDTGTSGYFRNLNNIQFAGYVNNGATTPLVMDLPLPHGARIRRIQAVLYDNTSSSNAVLRLLERPRPSATSTNLPMALAITTLTTSGSDSYTLLDSGAIDITLDLTTNIYSLSAGPSPTWEASQTLGVSMVMIEWTRE